MKFIQLFLSLIIFASACESSCANSPANSNYDDIVTFYYVAFSGMQGWGLQGDAAKSWGEHPAVLLPGNRFKFDFIVIEKKGIYGFNVRFLLSSSKRSRHIKLVFGSNVRRLNVRLENGALKVYGAMVDYVTESLRSLRSSPGTVQKLIDWREISAEAISWDEKTESILFDILNDQIQKEIAQIKQNTKEKIISKRQQVINAKRMYNANRILVETFRGLEIDVQTRQEVGAALTASIEALSEAESEPFTDDEQNEYDRLIMDAKRLRRLEQILVTARLTTRN